MTQTSSGPGSGPGFGPDLVEVFGPSQQDGGPELITILTPRLDVVSRTVSDSFRNLHDKLERGGVLGHPTAACPWLVPPMKRWTKDGGWRDVK